MGGGTTIRPTTTNQIIPPYTDKELTVEGSANLKASNIKKGIDIFGVIGTMEQGKVGIDFGTVVPTSDTTSITVKHNLGKIPRKIVITGTRTSTAYVRDCLVSGNEKEGLVVSSNNGDSTTIEFAGSITTTQIEFYYDAAVGYESSDFIGGAEYRWFAIA